jgi:hypothetical protein
MPQLLGDGARHIFSGGGRRNLAAHVEVGPRVLRSTLRTNRRRWRSGHHRSRDNSQLSRIRPCTMILFKTRSPLKKLTNEVIPHADVRVKVGNTRRRHARRRRWPSLLRGLGRGQLARTRTSSPRTRRRLAGPGGGRLRSRWWFATARGTRLCASPRLLRIAEMVPDPSDCPTLPRRILTILLHHCRYNSSNIPSIRKNLQLMSHTRRKYVFTGRAGDRNVPWPSTPGKLQHSRRRLPELGRRQPSPEGRASTH